VLGRAVAQAASRRLHTAATRIRARVWPCGTCGGQSSTGVGFLRVLRFLLPIFIPPTAPHSSCIVVAAVPSGLSLTPLKTNNKKTLRVISLFGIRFVCCRAEHRGRVTTTDT
jgi:hypothetical protein